MAPLSFDDVTVFAAENASGVALAQSPVTPFERWDVSAHVAVVSDYRLGGVTRSGHSAAIQGGVEIEHASGWSFGATASSVDIRKGGHYEAELHFAKKFSIGETELSVGALWAMIPEAHDKDFGLAQFTASHTAGPVDLTLAVNYAWAQHNIDDADNISAALRARTPIGRLAGIPITLGARVGYSEGSLAIEDKRTDWSVSATAAVGRADIGLAYSDTDLDDPRGDSALVLSFNVSF